MSLSVDVFRLDAGGEVEVLDVPPGCSDLAGFERWRRTVWGSDAARLLGARLLPELARGDLYVQAGQVAELAAECAVLRAGLDTLAAAAAASDRARTVEQVRQVISARLSNIEAAAHRATSIPGGGVLIW